MNLIEIILASAIMVIALVGITQVSSKSLYMSTSASTQAQVDAYLNNLIEADQKERKKGWDLFCTYLLMPTPTALSNFTLNVDKVGNCSVDGSIKITYTVTWSETESKSRTATYARY